MAFTLPTFNLNVDIYRLQGAGGTYGVPDVQAMGNLTPGRRVMELAPLQSGGAVPDVIVMQLLLPAGTDIRATWNAAACDDVEVPAGSARFYRVYWVDDIGKGFANEHRIAWIHYRASGNANLLGANSAPVPLP